MSFHVLTHYIGPNYCRVATSFVIKGFSYKKKIALESVMILVATPGTGYDFGCHLWEGLGFDVIVQKSCHAAFVSDATTALTLAIDNI